jgi:hypothetical protein
MADPDPFDTAEAFACYNHDDLSGLQLEDLDDERWRLRTARAFGLLTEWGRERLSRLDDEAERRRRKVRR